MNRSVCLISMYVGVFVYAESAVKTYSMMMCVDVYGKELDVVCV